MKKNKGFSLPVVGGSSLLTIFSVLCLVVFALLSVATVQSQRGLAWASAAATEGYYRADTRAEELLARLRVGEIPEGVTQSDDRENVYAYSCPVSDTQSLEVEVRLEGRDYTVLRWQVVSTVQWEENDKVEVWDGQ